MFITLMALVAMISIYTVISFILSLFEIQIGFSRFRLYPFAIDNFHIARGSTRRISVSKLRVQIHLPRISNPRWLTLTVTDCERKDELCHVYLGELRATFWLFPYLLRFTGGTLLSVDLDDFRLRVFTSRSSPGWVEDLRRNLIATVFTGHYLRIDDIKTKVAFSTLNGAPSYDSPVEKPGYGKNEEQDEVRVSLTASNWHIHNRRNARIYSFGKLDAQLRRSWVESRGTFVMIAENCRWVRAQPMVSESTRKDGSLIWYIMKSIFHFPSEVLKIIRDPASALDIFTPRADITFDHFRLRDSEIARHAGSAAKQLYDKNKREGSSWEHTIDFIADAIPSLGT